MKTSGDMTVQLLVPRNPKPINTVKHFIDKEELYGVISIITLETTHEIEVRSYKDSKKWLQQNEIM